MYLLDTNVISEFARREPNQSVTEFVKQAQHRNAEFYISALTVGEISKGIEKLRRDGDSRQATSLRRWMHDIKQEYCDHILLVDTDTAELWGAILAATDDTNAIDKLIAATAMRYDLIVVTRNVRHIAATGVKLINPF